MPFFHESFTQQACNASLQGKVALQFENEAPFTYKQLDDFSNQIAHFLIAKGINPGDRVSVILPPSSIQPIIFLALSKIGATYVPVDPHIKYPTERIKKILADCQPKVILTSHAVLQQRELDVNNALLFDDILKLQEELKAYSIEMPIVSCPLPPDLDAYIIYISGTTGTPKGVRIGHSGLLYWHDVLKTSRPDNRLVAGIISPSFDASIWEWVMAWSTGGKLHMAGQHTRDDLNAVVNFIETHHITDATLIPAQIKAINSLNEVLKKLKSSGLSAVYSTGEACTRDMVSTFVENGIDFWNCYGPTEATFGISILKDLLSSMNDNNMPIGFPISDTIKVYILDEQLQPVIAGETGILYIESPYLSKGYLNREQETQENFIDYTKPDGRQVRVYKTNDIFSQMRNHLYYHGRVNDSRALKMNGVLINLNEIEAAFSKLLDVKNVAVVAAMNDAQQTRLVAFIVTHTQQRIDSKLLHQALRSNLIDIAIPTHFEYISGLPLTVNGKLNYIQLKENALRVVQQAYQVSPEHVPYTPLEAQLSILWKSQLGISSAYPLDTSTAFTEFGGNSLCAFSMLSAVKNQFVIDVSIKNLGDFGFDADASKGIPFNIYNLARYIRYMRRQQYPQLPIELLSNSSSNKRCIFLIPPITGQGTFAYHKFSQKLHMHLDTKIYALNARGLTDLIDIHADIEEIAQDFATIIHTTQPEDKLVLLGWSFGGILAYKIAELLEKQGRKIKFVGLIDTLSPAIYQNMSQEEFAMEIQGLASYLCDILQKNNFLSASLKLNASTLSTHEKQQQINLVFDELFEYVKLDPSLYKWLYVTKINMLTNLSYKPEKIKTKELHLYNTELAEKKYADTALGWRRNNVTLSAPLKGDHFSIINDESDLSALVDEITNTLENKLEHNHYSNDEDTFYQNGQSPPNQGSLEDPLLRQLDILKTLILEKNRGTKEKFSPQPHTLPSSSIIYRP